MTVRAPIWPPPLLEAWTAGVDQDQAPSWILPPFIPADSAVWITGVPKRASKTMFALQCVRCVASGRASGLLKPTCAEGLPVLIVEQEGSRRGTRARFARLATGDGWTIPQGRVWFAHRYPVILTARSWLDRLCVFVQEHHIRLVLLDSFAKLMCGDENSTEDVSEMCRAIDQIRNAGASVMYIHHRRKPSRDRNAGDEDMDDSGRGSSALAGYYDTHLAFDRKPDGTLLLTVRDREGAEKYYKVVWDFDNTAGAERTRLVMAEHEPDAAPNTAVLQEALERMDVGQIYGMRALCDLWQLPQDVMQQVLRVLQESQLVKRTARGWARVG